MINETYVNDNLPSTIYQKHLQVTEKMAQNKEKMIERREKLENLEKTSGNLQ